jgi:hypothetical protein
MKIAKKIGAALLIAVGISEIVPIYTIFSGLSQGEGSDNAVLFLGKLFAHVLFAILFVLIGMRVFQSTRGSSAKDG